MKKQTIAILCGAFRPPHVGHYKMIEAYSEFADEVRVIISAPSKNSKSCRLVNGTPINPHIVETMLEIYCQNLPNVDISISESPSPVKGAYDLIETLGRVKVVVGGSTKDGVLDRRWASIKTYMETHNPRVEIIDDFIIKPEKIGFKNVSSTDFRYDLACNIAKCDVYIPDHIDNISKNEIYQLLGEMVSCQSEWC